MFLRASALTQTTQGGAERPGVESRDFSAPDETGTPEKTTVELVKTGGGQVGRYTFHAGWRWSDCIKPVVGTESCQVEHLGYVASGTLHVEHKDGSEGEVTPAPQRRALSAPALFGAGSHRRGAGRRER